MNRSEMRSIAEAFDELADDLDYIQLDLRNAGGDPHMRDWCSDAAEEARGHARALEEAAKLEDDEYRQAVDFMLAQAGLEPEVYDTTHGEVEADEDGAWVQCTVYVSVDDAERLLRQWERQQQEQRMGI